MDHAASVTTRYGSTNCVIRNVAFRNVEVDALPCRPSLQMQKKDAREYRIECAVKTCAKNFTVRNVRFSGLPKCTKIVKESPKGTIE